MRRRHMPSPERDRVTLCGHKTTIQEFQRIKLAKLDKINCKRCLKLGQKEREAAA
tara:strand:+ start:157 stop:321 length:165 start_codon:yes stop_codon:yes gene_type:complete